MIPPTPITGSIVTIAEPSDVTIRARSAGDWEPLWEICKALPVGENPLGVLYPGRELAQETFKAPDSNHTFGLVAEQAGRVVGEIAIERSMGRLFHVADIERFMVDPGVQGRGIGGMLIAACIDLAENSLNISRIVHLIPVGNAVALNLHRKHGFVIEGKLTDAFFYGGRYADAYLLARVRTDAF